LCKKIGWIGNLYKEQGLDCKKGAADSEHTRRQGLVCKYCKAKEPFAIFTGFWISFSNEKGVCQVHGPVDWVHHPWTVRRLDPRWTTTEQGRGAHQSACSRAAPTTGLVVIGLEERERLCRFSLRHPRAMERHGSSRR
jgi:hypothetical protein